jgi:hypothetical protein
MVSVFVKTLGCRDFCFVFSENIWVSQITASGPQSPIHNYMSSYHINTKVSCPQTLYVNMPSFHIYITASCHEALRLTMSSYLHCKKMLATFPSPAGMSLIKLSLGGNFLFLRCNFYRSLLPSSPISNYALIPKFYRRLLSKALR